MDCIIKKDYSNRHIDYSKRKTRPVTYDTLMQIRINKDLKDKLYKYCEQNKIPASDIVRKILEDYLKENGEVD